MSYGHSGKKWGIGEAPCWEYWYLEGNCTFLLEFGGLLAGKLTFFQAVGMGWGANSMSPGNHSSDSSSEAFAGLVDVATISKPTYPNELSVDHIKRRGACQVKSFLRFEELFLSLHLIKIDQDSQILQLKKD